MSNKIVPVAGTKNRVFVIPDEAQKVTAGGIIIPDTVKERPQKGKIVAVSEVDEDGKAPILKIGDVVLFSKFSGTELGYEDNVFLNMREFEVIAKIV